MVVSPAVNLMARREAHVIGFKEAAAWSGVWVGLAVVFGGVVFLGFWAGHQGQWPRHPYFDRACIRPGYTRNAGTGALGARRLPAADGTHSFA